MKTSCFSFWPASILVLLLRSLTTAAQISNNNVSIIDQSALLAFKSYITDDPGNILSNWTTNTSICAWIGVTCNSTYDNRVTSLNLRSRGLSGTIPPHVGNLSFLERLDLGTNSFGGVLPIELLQLRRLKYLNLGANNYLGQIPSWFGSFPSLEHMYLYMNNFSGSIPPSICNISSLKTLQLMSNILRGKIPDDIGNLTNLERILLYGNHYISGSIPRSIFNLPKLKMLELSINNLTGTLPDDVCRNLPSLQQWITHTNQLSGEAPANLGNCSQLLHISLDKNRFTGSIPRSFGNLTLLQQLYLSNDFFTGDIPEELGSLQNLQRLWLDGIPIQGPIPRVLLNLSRLWDLSLSDTGLTGNFPADIGVGLPSLQSLIIWGNELSGTLPSSIGNASQLTGLDIGINSFSGPIPSTIGNLRSLETLFLSGNYFTGDKFSTELTFLSSLSNCKNLTRLELDSNPLNGTIPASIGNLSTGLLFFSMMDCNIWGSIPKEIGGLSSLTTFFLDDNSLTGPIPDTIGSLESLQVLHFANNKLNGSIPDDICNITQLGEINLSGNQISGPIPSCLGDVSTLRILHLEFNSLRSGIPSALWKLRDILDFNLSSNSLTGVLPPDIGNLKVLVKLDLSSNQLSGSIPSLLGSLQNLASFSLARNRFQGPIPESFGSLISIESLDLSSNNLNGSIPKSLEQLLYLNYFNVSFNNLQGEIPNKGPFRNFSASSYLMNSGLCATAGGGAGLFLQFPACNTRTSGRSKSKAALKYVVVAAIAFILLVVAAVVFVLLRYRKRKLELMQPEADNNISSAATWKRISHQELEQATDGFCSSNLLGTGGYGSVYKGTFPDGTYVAIKVFNSQVEGAFRSFDAECEVLRKIRHRNLVKVISSFSNSECKALLLEYMPNGSLENRLYSHNFCLDIIQRLNVMVDVASALEYLHHGFSTPIVHCDLKPSNVLLDVNMVARVADFGIAKLLGGPESMTQTRTLATIGYMAPEYGSEGIVSVKGDVYSFGILLMETFTRKKPTDDMFVGEMSLARFVKQAFPNSVPEVVDANLLIVTQDDHFPAKKCCVSSIFELALDCTVESPSDRPNMGNVLAKLRNFRTKLLAVVAPPPPRPPRQHQPTPFSFFFYGRLNPQS